MEALGYFSALFMGISLGLIGGGGSILTVPILVYFFKLDGVMATTGSLFVVGSTALVGAMLNAQRRLVDMRTGALFALPSFAGVFFSRKILLPAIPDSMALSTDIVITKSLMILMAFSALMIFASRAMIRSGRSSAAVTEEKVQHSYFDIGLKGVLVGSVTGFVGAGGGFLIIPALVLLLHLPMRTAIGTSLAIIAANSLFGYSISSGVPPEQWKVLISITALGISGLFIGYRLSPRLPEKRLKQGFGYFVLAIGLFVLIEQSLRLR